MTKTVAFFDSGAGGLPYLKEAVVRNPHKNYLYLADTYSNPYGPRSEEDIIGLTEKGIRKILAIGDIEALVIACNTASVAALAAMRETFSFPIIGVVPAVKPAALASVKKNIGVLATESTVKSPYVRNLIDSFANGSQVHLVAAGDIVHYVEHRFFTFTDDDIETLVKPAADKLAVLDVDIVVLGCTHFIYVSDLLKSFLPLDVGLIDSREGVINQLFRVLPDSENEESGSVDIYCTGDGRSGNTNAESRYRRFAEYFGFRYRGVLNG